MNNSLLVVYSNLGLGGIPVRLITIVNRMTKSNPDTKIFIILKKRLSFDLRSTIQNRNAVIFDFTTNNSWNDSIRFIFWTWSLIFKLNPKTILSFISPYGLTVLITKILFFWRKTSIILNEGHYTSSMVNGMVFPQLQRLGIRLFYPLADVIIVPTHAIMNDLRHSFCIPDSKIRIIGNWTRLSYKPYKQRARPYDCIYIGRFEKEKNILPLLSMLESIIKTNKVNLKCLLIGDGSQKTLYEKQLRNKALANNIQIKPPTKEIAKYLLQSKILIFYPDKKTEGFPVAILDAMACGTIVVTRSFYGIEDVIDSTNGYIIHSLDEMEKRILKVIKTYKSQQKLISAAKMQIKKFNSLNNISEYTKLFHEKHF